VTRFYPETSSKSKRNLRFYGVWNTQRSTNVEMYVSFVRFMKNFAELLGVNEKS